MRLLLERFGYGLDSTVGALYLEAADGRKQRLCYTIEDERRTKKVPKETCIPTGKYEIRFRTEGTLHKKYGARFLKMHKGMMHLQNVKGFEWVYMHIGNTDDDTEGCPLLVTVPVLKVDGEFTGVDSTSAYVKVYKIVSDALAYGETVVLSIIEREPLGGTK